MCVARKVRVAAAKERRVREKERTERGERDRKGELADVAVFTDQLSEKPFRENGANPSTMTAEVYGTFNRKRQDDVKHTAYQFRNQES